MHMPKVFGNDFTDTSQTLHYQLLFQTSFIVTFIRVNIFQ